MRDVRQEEQKSGIALKACAPLVPALLDQSINTFIEKDEISFATSFYSSSFKDKFHIKKIIKAKLQQIRNQHLRKTPLRDYCMKCVKIDS